MARNLIGRLAGEYQRGRRDAKAGTYATSQTVMYRLGFRDETHRMEEKGEHPQCVMPLDFGQNALTDPHDAR